MRLIYNDALNKRIAPYLERLTKKRTSLDKETMTLLDVFMQYFNTVSYTHLTLPTILRV